MTNHDHLYPKKVWGYFFDICKIPHCSEDEHAIQQYIISVAKAHQLPYKVDDFGNIVVLKKASSSDNIITLQAHLDMVCEKRAESKHDFFKDPIIPIIEDDWVGAKDTSLGADNGIGAAICLALMTDNSLQTQSLELLFTATEEISLIGASNIEEGFLSGNSLINLDAEDFGEVVIGCAGGLDSVFKVANQSVNDFDANKYLVFELTIANLKGGHSGVDINKSRMNAIKIIAQILYECLSKEDISIIDFSGGSRRNAIPRDCQVVFAGDKQAEKSIVDHINKKIAELKTDLDNPNESLDISLSIKDNAADMKVLSVQDSKKVIALVLNIPYGVLDYYADDLTMVKTSSNLATIKIDSELKQVVIGTSQRSSSKTGLNTIQQQMDLQAWLAGVEIEHGSFYPPWIPNRNSSILQKAQKLFSELYNRELKVTVMHAGLEPGIFQEKFPNMDMISLGPDIVSPHCPDEKVRISSVAKIWDYLLELVK